MVKPIFEMRYIILKSKILTSNILNLLKKPFTLGLILFTIVTANTWARAYTYTSEGWDANGKPTFISSADTITIEADCSLSSLDNQSGATITIQSGASLTVTGNINFSANVVNKGSLVIANSTSVDFASYSGSGNLTNNGNITFSTNLTLEGSVTNKYGARITSNSISLGSTTNTSASITNEGTIYTNDSFTNYGSVDNSGTFSVTNSITNYGIINNTGTMSASTSITNNEGASFTNTSTITAGNNVINSGTFISSGEITSTTGTKIEITNSGNSASSVTSASTYYWIGSGSVDGEWTDGNNWSTSSGGTAAGTYPGQYFTQDEAWITINNASVSLTKDITISTLYIENTVTINLSSYTLDLLDSNYASQDHNSEYFKGALHLGREKAANLTITGYGNFTMDILDENEAEENSFIVDTNAKVTVRGHIWADANFLGSYALKLSGKGSFSADGASLMFGGGAYSGLYLDTDIQLNAATKSLFTFEWKSTATSNDWKTGDNWVYGRVPSYFVNILIPSSASNFPVFDAPANYSSTFNTITIEDSAELSLSAEISVKTYDFNSSGKLILDASSNDFTFTNTSGANLVIPSLEIKGTKTLTIDSNNKTISAGTLSLTSRPDLTVIGELILPASEGFGDITIGDGSSDSSLKFTGTGDSSITSLTIKEKGTFIPNSGKLTNSGNWVNNAGNSGFTYGTSNIIFSGTNPEISGTNTFYSLKADSTTTITFSDDLTVTNTFIAGPTTFFMGNCDFSALTTFTHSNGTIYYTNQDTSSSKNFKTSSDMALNSFNFSGNVNIVLKGNVTASEFKMNSFSDAYYFTSDTFTASIQGNDSNTLTLTGIKGLYMDRCSSGDTIPTLDIQAPVTCINLTESHSGTIFKISDSFTTQNFSHNASSGEKKSQIIIDGTMTVTDTLDVCASSGTNAGSTEITINSGKSLIAKTITKTSADSKTYTNSNSDYAIINKGTIEFSDTFILPEGHNYSGSGKFIFDTSSSSVSFSNINTNPMTISRIEINGTDGNTSTIYGKGAQITVNALSLTDSPELVILGSVELVGNTGFGPLTIGNGSDTSTLTFSGSNASKVTSLKILAKGKLVPNSGTLTLTGDFTNDGTFTPITGSVVLSPVGDSIEIKGSTSPTFNNLSMENAGGKSLILSVNTGVSGNLKLSGSSDSSKLSIASTSGNFGLKKSQYNGKYLDVSSSGPKIWDSSFKESDISYYASYSSPTDGSAPYGWKIYSSSAFIWLGTSSNSWSKDENWANGSVPTASDSDSSPYIIISSNATNWPEVSGVTLDLSSNSSTFEMEENTEISLDSSSSLSFTNAILAGSISADGSFAAGSISQSQSLKLSGNILATTFTVTNDINLTGNTTFTGTLVFAKSTEDDTKLDITGSSYRLRIEGTSSNEGTSSKTTINEDSIVNLATSLEISDSSTGLINNGNLNLQDGAAIKGQLTNKRIITLAADFQIDGDLINESTGSINSTSEQTLALKGDFTDLGNIGENIIISFTGDDSSTTQTFTNKSSTTYSKIDFQNTSAGVTLTEELTATTITALEDSLINLSKHLTAKTITLGKVKVSGTNLIKITSSGSQVLSVLGNISVTSDNSQSLEIISQGGLEAQGNLGNSESVKLKALTITSTNQDILFSDASNIFAYNLNVTCKNATFKSYIVASQVTLAAIESIAVNGLTADSFTIDTSSDSPKSIKFADTIKIDGGDLTIDYAVTLTDNTSFNITNGNFILASSGSITPETNSTSSTSDYNLDLTAKQIQLNSDIASASKKLKTIIFKSPIRFAIEHKKLYARTCQFTDNSGFAPESLAFDISDDCLISTNITFPHELTVPGNLTNDSNAITTFTNGVLLAGNFKDSGIWSGEIILNGNLTSSSNPVVQTFTGSTNTAYDVKIQKANNYPTKFISEVTFNTITTSSQYPGSIQFDSNVTLNNDTYFNTSVIANLASASADSISAVDKTISFQSLTLKKPLTINCADLTFKDNVETSASDTSSNYLKINGNFKTNGSSISIESDIMLNGNYNGNSNSGDTTFEGNLYIFGSETSEITLEEVTVLKDLIFDAPRPVNTKGTIKAQNIVLYRGTIKAADSSKLQAAKDIVLLGAYYNIDSSIKAGEYKYQQSRTSGDWQYERSDFTSTSTSQDKMPDGTVLSTAGNFTGIYQGGVNSVLYATKNFYANGLKSDTYPMGLTMANAGDDSQHWYIDLPNLTDIGGGFAETYYSFVDSSWIRCWYDETRDGTSDGSNARMPAYECDYEINTTTLEPSTNHFWIFKGFEITDAYTIRDNVICIVFNRPVRNAGSELINAVSRFKFKNNSGTNESFAAFYTDEDCTEELTNVHIREDDKNLVKIYIKTKGSTWNTDATGISAGSSSSTDRNGNHKSAIPYIEISADNDSNPVAITDLWGKRLEYYAGDARFTKVEDHTGPVLYSVRSGQELHTAPDGNAESQSSYDSHNFLEFRYSEPVNFGLPSTASSDAEQVVSDNSDTSAEIWLPAAAATESDGSLTTSNIRVNDNFGALKNDITQEGNLSFAGIAKVESGLIHTGSQGTTNKYVNSLYRPDKYSIRIGIAAYTEGTVNDTEGNTYKKWIGYIEKAQLPSGQVTMLTDKNTYVTDCALKMDSDSNPTSTALYNCQVKYLNPVIPSVNVNLSNGEDYTKAGVYGAWDISEPIFAPIRMTPETLWDENLVNHSYEAEAIGNTSGVGSTLDRIEFHIWDNTPAFDSTIDTAEWYSEIGWCQPGLTDSVVSKDDLYAKDINNIFYTADIFGGSRQFSTDDDIRTSGGIRYSSLENAAQGFKYIDSTNAVPDTSFESSSKAYPKVNSVIFSGTSAPRRSSQILDGTYFALSMGTTSFDIKTQFTISYDENRAFITDLAGNRLRNRTFTTIDRTPPSFDITLGPINSNEIYITFVKELITNSSQLVYISNDDDSVLDVSDSGSFEEIIPSCFKLISINESGAAVDSTSLTIDTDKAAQIIKPNNKFTSIKLFTNRNITLDDVKNLYVTVKSHPDYPVLSRDPSTGHINSRVTFIQDYKHNYLEMYTAHALSDFAIGVINPLYAYDENMSEDNSEIMNGLYEEGSWAVHDWNENQKNYGTLPLGHDIAIVSEVDDGSSDKSSLPEYLRIYLSDNPDDDSVSAQYNKDFGRDLRIWLPNVTNKVFSALAESNNTNYNYYNGEFTDGKSISSGLTFHIPESTTTKWKSGSQISFLFGLMDSEFNPINIIHSPELDLDNTSDTSASYLSTSIKYPLYALRLKDATDITSIDLWSFKVKSITNQRGGVTILNNVINNTNGEKTIIKVDLPEESRLNVIVMTLDGNVIKYLNKGRTSAGEHYYSWDGKNNKGNLVARGMYFIRISSDNIDETRKVLVVK